MPFLIRLTGTEDYYSEFAPYGTTKENATRLSADEASDFVRRSVERKGNRGKAKVEMVEVED